jgi:hypothetical protein
MFALAVERERKREETKQLRRARRYVQCLSEGVVTKSRKMQIMNVRSPLADADLKGTGIACERCDSFSLTPSLSQVLPLSVTNVAS